MTSPQEAWNAARRSWPSVLLPEQRFAAHAQVVETHVLAERASDLYIAWACAEGCPGAAEAFDAAYLSDLRDRFVRYKLTPVQLGELAQRARIRLLTGSSPRIALYEGRSALRTWVGAVVLRLALNLLEEERTEAARRNDEARTDGLGEALVFDSDPELVVARETIRPRFQQALDQSLRRLNDRDRTIMNLHFVDGLNIDEIGKVFHVHRATVARWILRIRGEIFDSVRTQCGLRLPPTSSEWRSVVRLLSGQIGISVERLLSVPQENRDAEGGQR